MKAEGLVIDTNVLIAALLAPASTPGRLVEWILRHDVDIPMSEDTFPELQTRFERPKFDLYGDWETWGVSLAELVELATWHEGAGTAVSVSRDPDDDQFLAPVASGQTEAIVSGDSDLLVPRTYDGFPMMTPAQFLRGGADPQ